MRDPSARSNIMTDSISGSSNEIDGLAKEITEDTLEHGKIMKIFDRAISDFASDRSFETCLNALNTSIQVANIRHKLLKSYWHYSELLETEIILLTRQDKFGPKK